MALSKSQVRDLVRRFVAIDMTGWDDAAFDRAIAHLGWGPESFRSRYDDSTTIYDVGLDGGRGLVSREGNALGSMVSLRLGEGEEVFHRLRSAVENALGLPTIMRGPGPMLRWRGAQRLLELEYSHPSTYLRIRPTEAVEQDEFRTAKWAEPEDGLSQLGYWEMVGPDADWMLGGYWADNWDEFEERLAKTLLSVIGDFSLLGRAGHFTVVVSIQDAPGFVQWTTLVDWTLHLEAHIPDGAGPEWSRAMAELGWQSADGEPLLARNFPTLGHEEAATAARMLVGALRSYGAAFEDLRHVVISPGVTLLGIGIPREGHQRI